jgi:site-specific DNA-methyltransferase (adenine-specific)
MISVNQELLLGDCLTRLGDLPAECIDAIVTDPPYELGFMGKGWDQTGIAYNVDVWKAVLRVLKPGGHLLAFGGSRTYHRLASAIEDAGFEIRDQIMWLYGQGFPKSLNVSKAIDKAAGAERTEVVGRYQPPEMDKPWNLTKAADERIVTVFDSSRNNLDILAPVTNDAKQWDGWGTALKPAHEPIVLARKPFAVTVAANVLTHGTGALNIDGCRVGDEVRTYDLKGGENLNKLSRPDGNDSDDARGCGAFGIGAKQVSIGVATVQGRWPANVIHDGSDEVLEAFPDAPGQRAKSIEDGAEQGNNIYSPMKRGGPTHVPRVETNKCAARFFYCAKASKKDRGDGNSHPTVKPTELMRYLLRLITPPGGKVLDPFMGSGSTGKAAALEGFHFIGIEKEPAYFDIAKERVEASYALAV